MTPSCSLQTLTQETDPDLQGPFVAADKRQNSNKNTEAKVQNAMKASEPLERDTSQEKQQRPQPSVLPPPRAGTSIPAAAG